MRFPVSVAQRGMWIEQQKDPAGNVFNLSHAVRIAGGVDEQRLRSALARLVLRHPSLTLRFAPDGLTQEYGSIDDLDVQVIDLSGASEAELIEKVQVEADRPFDLAKGVFRARIFRAPSGDPIFLLSIHHVAADLWSYGILLRDLGEEYDRGSESVAPAVVRAETAAGYERFVEGQQDLLGSSRGLLLEQFWMNAFEGGVPALSLPQRPADRDPAQCAGSSVEVPLGPALVEKVRAFAASRGTTPYVVLLATYLVLLRDLAGEDDVMVGSPFSGRSKAAFRETVGYFVNLLPIRQKFAGDATFDTLVGDLSRLASTLLRRQDYPLEEIARILRSRKIEVPRPFFRATFVYERPRDLLDLAPFILGCGEFLKVGSMSWRSHPLRKPPSEFPLQLVVVDTRSSMLGALEYQSSCLDASGAQRLARGFVELLERAISEPVIPVARHAVAARAESLALIRCWNATDRDFGEPLCLHEPFEAQARRSPEAIALIFEGRSITYRELERRASRFARRLRSSGVGKGTRVGVCADRSIELVVALYAILKAGGAYVPFDPTYPAERLRQIAEDSAVGHLLVQPRYESKISEVATCRIHLLPSDVGSAAETAEGAGDSDRSSEVNSLLKPRPEDTAYVIFTSGSTGRPKGAMISHASIHNRLAWMQQEYGLGSGDRVLQKTPYSFDVSVWELFWPLQEGATLVILGPEEHKDPRRIAEVIREQQVTTLHFVPSMLQAFLDEPEARGLSSMKRVFCSGEALPYSLQERFFSTFDCDLHNLYGPTEAAVDVTFWQCRRQDSRAIVPIGRPVANTQIHILDSSLQPVAIGVTGELYIAGVQVGQGYVNRPELTADRFVPDPFSSRTGARMYRTGDLARWLDDGSIEYLGRNDHQVKIRGFRIEIGEIEAALMLYPDFAQVAVIVGADSRGGRQLDAFIVAKDGGRSSAALHLGSDLRIFLGDRLPSYMVPATFTLIPRMPLTASGKLDRKELARLLELHREDAAASEHARPLTPSEQVIAIIWQDLLNLKQVRSKDHFLELGGHSLLAARVLSRLRQHTRRELPMRLVFDHLVLHELAAAVDNAIAYAAPHVPEQEALGKGVAPRASLAQERLWFIHQLDPASTAYHMPAAVRIQGELDTQALENAIDQVISAHDALRTSFRTEGDDLVLVVHSHKRWRLETVEGVGGDIDALIRATVNSPFDLQREAPFRIRLIRDSAAWILVFCFHHIIVDGWSLELITREISEAYRHRVRPRSPSGSYAAHAAWQRRSLDGGQLAAELGYWKNALAGELPVLSLPADRPRPESRSFRGASIGVDLDPELSRELRALAIANDSSLFVVLLSVFSIVLSRLAQQKEVVIGTPVANRLNQSLENVVGLFVNTLALRIPVDERACFDELLRRVKKITSGALENQVVPFEKVVEAINPKRTMAHTPVFQAMLSFENKRDPDLALDRCKVSRLGLERGVSQFDLTLSLRDSGSMISGAFEYSVDLFDECTVRRFAERFRQMLKQVVLSPGEPLGELSLLSEAEKRRLLAFVPAPERTSLVELFRAAARANPGLPAIEDAAGNSLSYSELDAASDQVAIALRALGADSGCVVALCFSRSIELIVCMMGILKSGAAYLPIDPEYPAERKNFILGDARALLLVSHSDLAKKLQAECGAQARVFELDELAGRGARELGMRLPSVGPESLAYVIYTSGSSGRPKGVAITHASAANLATVLARRYEVVAGKRVLHFYSAAFDAAVEEIFTTMCAGATLVLRPDDIEASRFAELLRAKAIQIANVPTAYWYYLVKEFEQVETVEFGRLELMIVGGEASQLEQLRSWRRLAPGVRWINAYGPTETTVTATIFECSTAEDFAELEQIPIGVPIDGVQVLLLNEDLRLVPPGTVGEICIAGAGVAQGYLGRPELEAEKFVSYPEAAGGRIYRTGDRGRMNARGQLVFVGRSDRQVKVRGYRIELDEVEILIRREASVRDVAVELKALHSGSEELVAYVSVSDAHVGEGELRERLSGIIPAYMTPRAWIVLDQLPLTAGGKVDRQRLPDPASPTGGSSVLSSAGSRTEQRIFEIWAQLLGRQDLSIDENFFDMGAHSLLLLRAKARVQQEFGLELQVMELFRHPSIRRLAAHVDGLIRGVGPLSQGERPGLTARVRSGDRVNKLRDVRKKARGARDEGGA